MKRNLTKIGVGAASGLFAIALAISFIPAAQLKRASAAEHSSDGNATSQTQKIKDKKTYPSRKTMSDQELRSKLTGEQYRVAVQGGTEPAFRNEHWDNKREGLYVDVISGKPLFASSHKFDSGTGWPSFYRPIDGDEIVEVSDRSYGMIRTEVRSKTGDAHLGHVFDDGPAPTGLRYCINSAALKFIPAEKLTTEGYGEYAKLFEPAKKSDAKE